MDPIISNLFQDCVKLIETAKKQVASYVNSSLVLLYWTIGGRINLEVLQQERADYGEQIIKQLAKQLNIKYGRGFTRSSLFQMIRLAKLYDQSEIIRMSSSLSWSHFIELIPVEDSLKRQFYTELCSLERWSVRELRKKVDSMLYERTALSRKPEQLIQKELEKLKEEGEVSKDLVFRDPYVLDFLDLPAEFSESDFEKAILDELGQFLQELGNDFCFIGRQKRITIDNEDFYIDLLMFHRGLRRLVAIELKIGKFSASYKGQMELYLRWLDKHERRVGEESPLGLILCTEKKQEHIELLELDKSGIHVAEYMTQLLPKEIFEEKLRKAIEIAKERHIEPKSLSDATSAI